MKKHVFSFAEAREALISRAPHIRAKLEFAEIRLDKCESDLERWFITSFVYGFGHSPIFSYNGAVPPPLTEPLGNRYTVDIAQQVTIAGYRCDFLFTVKSVADGSTMRVAVECDGHSFHDRTKEQASYDRRRDRRLLAEGVPTIRYTYSDLVGDTEASMLDLRRTILAISSHVIRESEPA